MGALILELFPEQGLGPEPAPPGAVPGVHPFSILRSDLGPWRERRRAWKDLGLDSQRGREHVQTYAAPGGFGADMLRKFKGGDGASTFDPVLAETHYAWYCPEGGRILDPFAGGSVRGLVAGNGGYQYDGVDLSGPQIDANEEQAEDWQERDLLAEVPRWHEGDAADVLPEFKDESFDYVFTCPPCFNLERYSDHPADLSAMKWREFTEAYQEIIAESVRCLAEDRFATWVVGEVRNSSGAVRGLAPLTIAAHEAAGVRLYNDAVLMNSIGTTAMRLPQQWRASRKIDRIHQYVLTFVKGDPKKATQALPVPEKP